VGLRGETMRLSHSWADPAFHRASEEGRSRESSEKGRKGELSKRVAVSTSVRKTMKQTLREERVGSRSTPLDTNQTHRRHVSISIQAFHAASSSAPCIKR
jgi:hypothetical protein